MGRRASRPGPSRTRATPGTNPPSPSPRTCMGAGPAPRRGQAVLSRCQYGCRGPPSYTPLPRLPPAHPRGSATTVTRTPQVVVPLRELGRPLTAVLRLAVPLPAQHEPVAQGRPCRVARRSSGTGGSCGSGRASSLLAAVVRARPGTVLLRVSVAVCALDSPVSRSMG